MAAMSGMDAAWHTGSMPCGAPLSSAGVGAGWNAEAHHLDQILPTLATADIGSPPALGHRKASQVRRSPTYHAAFISRTLARPHPSGLLSGMTGWTPREATLLAGRWQQKTTGRTLPGACPHCLHNGAFTSVHVPYAIVVGDMDSQGVTRLHHLGKPQRRHFRRLRGNRAPSPATTWSVSCDCGHAEHAPDKGCGRSGNIALPSLVSLVVTEK